MHRRGGNTANASAVIVWRMGHMQLFVHTSKPMFAKPYKKAVTLCDSNSLYMVKRFLSMMVELRGADMKEGHVQEE